MQCLRPVVSCHHAVVFSLALWYHRGVYAAWHSDRTRSVKRLERMADEIPQGQAPLTLASASPRRRELLTYLGVPFVTVATAGEELNIQPPPAVRQLLPPLPLPLDEHPTLLAWRKAVTAQETVAGPILAADTIVVLDDSILGKPHDPSDAERILRLISGRTHVVYTGLALLHPAHSSEPLFDLVSANVTIAPLSDEQITGYVATGEPLDKAGAYGLQGLGGELVTRVEGSCTAVVGLPLPATERLLRAAGIPVPISAEEAFQRWRKTLRKEPPQCIA